MNPQIQEIYDKIFEQVEKLGTIRDTDKSIIESLAFNFYTVRKMEELLLELEFVMDGLHGSGS